MKSSIKNMIFFPLLFLFASLLLISSSLAQDERTPLSEEEVKLISFVEEASDTITRMGIDARLMGIEIEDLGLDYQVVWNPVGSSSYWGSLGGAALFAVGGVFTSMTYIQYVFQRNPELYPSVVMGSVAVITPSLMVGTMLRESEIAYREAHRLEIKDTDLLERAARYLAQRVALIFGIETDANREVIRAQILARFRRVEGTEDSHFDLLHLVSQLRDQNGRAMVSQEQIQICHEMRKLSEDSVQEPSSDFFAPQDQLEHQRRTLQTLLEGLKTPNNGLKQESSSYRRTIEVGERMIRRIDFILGR